MSARYYAVRYISAPSQTRIEKAVTPERAFHLAFGHPPSYLIGADPCAEYLDLGPRKSVVQSRAQLSARLAGTWTVFATKARRPRCTCGWVPEDWKFHKADCALNTGGG